MITALVERLGAFVLQSITSLGQFSYFFVQVFFWMFKRPFRIKLLFEQLFFVGNKSLFIIMLTGGFTGMVMCYQTYFGFKLVSADNFVGPLVAISLAKELAPVFSGLVVAGRAGAAMAAAIGSMKVTEQVDALEVMGINSIQYLAVPRVVASTLVLPLLTIIFQFVGNAGAWLVGVKVLKIEEAIYFSKLSEFMFVSDIAQGVIKAYFFGLAIATIGTYFGFTVQGGAEGVGKNTNLAVIWGMVTVLVADFILTSFLVRVL
ncbi:MAG: ABC transporter permease [Bacteriovoracales bacterium]|nr:ABC transporter permease [Bacteriovoracales bacterium]